MPKPKLTEHQKIGWLKQILAEDYGFQYTGTTFKQEVTAIQTIVQTDVFIKFVGGDVAITVIVYTRIYPKMGLVITADISFKNRSIKGLSCGDNYEEIVDKLAEEIIG